MSALRHTDGNFGKTGQPWTRCTTEGCTAQAKLWEHIMSHTAGPFCWECAEYNRFVWDSALNPDQQIAC